MNSPLLSKILRDSKLLPYPIVSLYLPILSIDPEVDARPAEQSVSLGEIVHRIHHDLVGEATREAGTGGAPAGIALGTGLFNEPFGNEECEFREDSHGATKFSMQ